MFVPGNRGFDQFLSGYPLLPQGLRNLDQWTGEQFARHRYLLSGTPDRQSVSHPGLTGTMVMRAGAPRCG
jgi:hypothetical protein